MALDPSIALRINPMRVESQDNALMRIMSLQGAMRQNELGGLQLEQAKQQGQQEQAWRAGLGANDPATPEGLSALMRIDPARAAAIQKAQLEGRNAQSQIDRRAVENTKTAAEVAKIRAEEKRRLVQDNLQRLGSVNDAAGAQAWIQGGVQSGLIDFKQAQAAMQAVPADPQAFAQWKRAQMMAGVEIGKQFDLANADRTHGLAREQAAATNANQLMTPDGSGGFVINQPLLAAKQQVAAAGKSSISINTGQRGLDNEFRLRGEFKGEPVYKAHQEMQAAHGQIKQAIAQASPAGDLAAATKIMKLLDPGSVVRESELGMAMQASGLLDRATNYAANVVNGTKLTPKQRADFQSLADRLYGESVKAFNAKRSEYETLGGAYELNAGRALGPAAADVKPGAAGSATIRFDANGKRIP